MSTLTDLHVIDFPGFPTVVVRGVDQRTDELHAFMDTAFRALGAGAARGLFVPAGPAFSKYEGLGESGLGDVVDLETGYPVDVPLAGPVEVDGVRLEPSSLPAGRLGIAKHHGPYDALPLAWDAFLTALRDDGHVPGEVFWEAYDTEPTPDTDPADLITGLAVPVREG